MNVCSNATAITQCCLDHKSETVVCAVQAPGPWCDRGQDVRGPISGGAHHLCS